ncbi:hypothetical protein BJ166DRAFT_1015 [Pestalotiopsis sp. NC0098]|nr:hypothetical protein BJ166DRAFT_1015 [Pestalotiopsis sp. NC0098]
MRIPQQERSAGSRRSLFFSLPSALAMVLVVGSLLVTRASANYLPPLQYEAVATLERRDAACPTNYVSCESQGSAFAGICCADGQYCALDQSSSPACCPTGAVCTGAATGTLTSPITATSTSVSYVSNSLFAFPAVATSFSNAAACSRAASACSSNYAACTSDLASGTGGYGVTIDVPGGGGVTVQPTHATQLAVSSAVSVCSSLSSQACHGLSISRCSAVGTTGGFVVGTANAAPPPRITAMPCLVGVAAGVGLGVLGAGL